MKTRQILALAALVPLAAGMGPADAAPRKRKPPVKVPTCNLVKDKRDDATGNGSGIVETPNDPSSDILSADIASNGVWVTAVIRVASVDPGAGNSPTGRAYDVTFLAHNKVVAVRALVSQAGELYFDGKGQGTVDRAKNEVRIHVKIADLGIPLKPNDRLGELKAVTWRWVGKTQVSLGKVDDAAGPLPYVAGWPSCVKVGP